MLGCRSLVQHAAAHRSSAPPHASLRLGEPTWCALREFHAVAWEMQFALPQTNKTPMTPPESL